MTSGFQGCLVRGGMIVILAIAAVWAGETSVNELIGVVRSGIKQHTVDKILAKTLHKVALTEHLNLRPIEELESEGAGPETITALYNLHDDSEKKPEPTEIPRFESPARPTIDEQKSIFHEIDVNAMHYSASLPNFICTEIIRRYELTPPTPPGAERRRGTPAPPLIGVGIWNPKDTLTVKLSYFGNREKYELTLVNGRKTKETYESAGGAVSEGEFGSVLLEIFSPESKTKFQWDHWTHLRKRLTGVYSYRTAREWSHYKIGVGQGDGEHRLVTAGRRGYIYADNETHLVMRIVGEAIDIPGGFPITAQSSMLDYEYATISGQKFLLPLRADLRMKTARIQFKNIVEFHDYRKFTGESSISFDVPEPEKTEQEPKP